MKRSGLQRKQPLKRKPFSGSSLAGRAIPRKKPSALSTQAARGVVRTLEPGEAEWKRKRWGHCDLCRTYGRVVFHHLVDEHRIRSVTSKEQQEAGIAWDARNALRVGAPLAFGGNCQCHASHHLPGTRDTRIRYEKVSPAAREFAVEVLGEGPAFEYFRRHYRGAP